MQQRAAEGETTTQAVSASAWAPLREPVFRMLWITWLVANVCMWMNDVAAAWLMTTLTPSPMMVALVQSASTLPVFLLGLPSGALADILDRRRYFMVTQLWVAVVALIMCATILAGAMTAPLLLGLTFANGIGLAMRWPVFAAIVPEIVPRIQLPAALALNGIAMNASRIVGPLLAGAIIASFGSAYVFVLNAVLSVAAGFVIWHWKREPKVSALPGERFIGAMRVGLQYVRQSERMRAVLLRIAIFFLQSIALLALLPLVAQQLHGGGAGTFTLLLAAMGLGAIIAASQLPQGARPHDARPAGPRRHGAAGGGHRGGGLRAQRLRGRAGAAGQRHGLDLGGQLAHHLGPARAAGLGARARHVDLPDGDDGQQRRWLPRCGARWRPSPACAPA